MKTKAVCDATGLTRKTVMFYEEKGLFSPQKVRMNGREISARMSHWTLARLYRAALKQNHREARFREDYGKGLSLRSARKALRADGLDRPVPIPQKPNLRNQMKELFR